MGPQEIATTIAPWQFKTNKFLLGFGAVLVSEEKVWEKQFEADVKTGKLDKLHKETLEDIRAKRFRYL